MSIQLQTEGRRTYITGNTYAVRDQIRAIGAHWDSDRKAWWTAKRAEAEALVSNLAASPAAAPAPSQSASSQKPRDGLDSVVAGRVTYKGRSYYVAGRRERGRTQWDDTVSAVTTSDGSKLLLYFTDGSSQFWASRDLCEVQKRYDRPQTISGLRKYAERAKQAGGGQLEDGYYYASNGEVLASGCSTCRQLGTMCRSCQHDYE